jgi:putative oxidoreductase
MLAEVVGGVALVAGFYSRIAAIALIPILLGAIVAVHGPAGFFFTNPNGGWEFPALWIVGLISVALLGDGAYALRPGVRGDGAGHANSALDTDIAQSI